MEPKPVAVCDEEDFDPGAEAGFDLERVGSAIILRPLTDEDAKELGHLRKRRDFPRHIAFVPAVGKARGCLVVNATNIDMLYAWLCETADRSEAMMMATDGLITAVSGWR